MASISLKALALGFFIDLAKGFQIKDLVELLPDTPRRILERDLELLVEKKGRTYS